MPRVICFLLAVTITVALSVTGNAQEKQAPKIVQVPVSSTSTNAPDALLPLNNSATIDQIKEYLRVSGESESYRLRWIAAVDKNRSIGAPYWPESFWTSLKLEMRKTDLLPMYVTLYQHSISMDLMQDILEAYRRLGSGNFSGSPECFKLGEALFPLKAEMDKMTLANTLRITHQVYDVYKPQIKAARLQYKAEHPDWKDQ